MINIILNKIRSIIGKKEKYDNPFTEPRVIDKRIEKYSRCTLCGNDTLEEVIDMEEVHDNLKKHICTSCGEVHYSRNSNL